MSPSRATPDHRVAFVGQGIYFESCVPGPEVEGLRPTFIDFREGDDPEQMRAAIHAADPQIAFFFKPDLVPPGLLAGLPCITVGYATEPLSSISGDSHSDLDRRRAEFARLDPKNFDRMIVYNQGISDSVEEIMPVWRCVPLPVADRYYRDARPTYRSPRVIFIGRSTNHRETLLSGVKHRHNITHIAHGVGPAELEQIVDTYDVGINLHNETYPNFENRVCIHLAGAHLVLSEPLTPTMGLEPGIDYLEVRTASELTRRVSELVRVPDIHQRVRVRGRAKAELFRASRVYPALVRDLLHDISVFGSAR